jgi:hypothetical protein
VLRFQKKAPACVSQSDTSYVALTVTLKISASSVGVKLPSVEFVNCTRNPVKLSRCMFIDLYDPPVSEYTLQCIMLFSTV